jgi:XTP/dITP diphosphohydrolase
MDLLIATSNRGKTNELTRLLHLEQIEMRLLTLADVPVTAEPEETGITFDENAAIKAAHYAVQTGLWTLADDSGLEVAALDGRPGVLSARYGGRHLDYPAKMRLLLDELAPHSDRSARFASAAVIATPSRRIVASAFGECRGRIAQVPRGTN